jgi:hypothetical protein
MRSRSRSDWPAVCQNSALDTDEPIIRHLPRYRQILVVIVITFIPTPSTGLNDIVIVRQYLGTFSRWEKCLEQELPCMWSK